ncbi:MinD/ParA family protein [Arthrobacter sp. NPDC093139]|uniref:MinD/ParA family ATP-binding protein n=1 Tax=Arthrobacter sp. NPDC093139 TaxID=3363945 RepID=UPI00380B9808
MASSGDSSGDISVVTVSDAQDRTSAGSLSALRAVPHPGAVPAGLPVATVGMVGVDAAGRAAPETGAPETAAPDTAALDTAALDTVEAATATAEAEEESDTTETAEAAAVNAENHGGRRERPEGPEPAAALTADRLLNKAAAAPVAGWRRWLYTVTFGYVNLGDSDRIRIQRAMEHRIAMRLGERTRYVPVLSRKGGVGKTTVTTLLGMVLADLREDRVIAMDANPDRGTLSDRSPGRADFTARQLVKDRFTVDSFAQLSNYTARDGSRLDVLASDTDPMVAHAFDDADYRAVTDILGRYYSIVLTDSGTGMVHSVMKGTLEKADAVVLVSGGSVDEARLASETLSWLEAHGRQDLVAKATVVINMAAGDRTLVNIDEIEQHFLSRVKNVVRIPHDRHLAEGSRIQLSQLKPATRSAAVELAALVIEELQQA